MRVARIRPIHIIPIIRILERTIGVVAFDAGTAGSVWVVKVPAPAEADQVQCALSLSDGKLALYFEGLDKGDDVGGEFWGYGADGAPVLWEIGADIRSAGGRRGGVEEEGHAVGVFRVDGAVKGGIVSVCSVLSGLSGCLTDEGAVDSPNFRVP